MTEITIRAFEMKDWEDVSELFMAPNCRWGTLQMPYQSRDDIRKKLESPPGNIRRLVAECEGKVVGMLGLHTYKDRRSHACGLGMFVHDDYQGRGIGSRLMEASIELAERWLGLTRMELTVFTDNDHAVALYKKFNFIIEGTHFDYARREGEFVDTFAMARVTR
jgi:L-phenylalanine/L-methionine N-acetyltransferase